MSSTIRKTMPVITATAVLWIVLVFTQKTFLFKNADLSLFLFDWNFLKESFLVPGGFLGWAGSFFTQFLYIPWLGALLWTILLMTAGILTVRILKIPESLSLLAILPIALLVIANMSLGYGIFIQRVQDYFFAPTLGYLLMLAVMAAAWNAQKGWHTAVILTVSAFAGYVLAGIFALAGVFAAGIGLASDCGRKKRDRIIAPVLSAALCIIAPLLLYGLYTRYRIADSWTMGLPTVSDDQWTAAVRLPYHILIVITSAFALAKGFFARTGSDKRHRLPLQAGIAAVAIGSVVLFWYKDENFRTELEMSVAADNFDWEKVTDIYRNASERHLNKEKKAYGKRQTELKAVQDASVYNDILKEYEDRFFEPTRLMVMLRDLALLKQDKALDMAFRLRDGGRSQKSRTQIPMAFQAARQLYLNYGLINMEYRWCLEDQVEHGWCYGTLKYMAMHATLMNETEFAAKYLDKLDKTLFYRKWSRSQRPLSADSLAMSKALPYREIIPYMSFDDRMSNDRVKVETYIMKHFLEERDKQATHQFDCAALLWAMRSQNIPMFWKALSQYIDTATEISLPQSVQEAIILYSSLENTDMGIEVSKKVTDSYAAFQKYIQRSGFRSEKEASFPMYLRFGNTFFYYYYFVRGLQTF